jgi:hypothetical protein
MQRNRNQVLYRYRPRQTFDHPGSYVAQVRGYGPDTSRDSTDVDPGYLIEAARRFVRRWRSEGRSAGGASPNTDRAPEFPDESAALAAAQYDLVEPGRVFCRVWPRSIRCANPRCGLVWTVPDPVAGVDEWPPVCPRCGHTAGNRQLQYVFVHPCGEALSVQPPDECPRCHRSPHRLIDVAARFQDFRWECLGCRASTPIRAFCPNRGGCNWTDKMMTPQVHTASAAYVGHGVTVINPRQLKFAQQVGRPEFVVATIGRWLGVCSEEEFDRLIGSAASPAEVAPEIMTSIELMEASGNEALVEQARQLRDRFVPPDLTSVRTRVGDVLGYDPLGPDERGRTLAQQLELYGRVLELPSVTLARLEATARSAGRATRYSTYGPALHRAGLDPGSMRLVTEFPVIRLAVGFSRGGFQPYEADLVAYRDRAGRGQATKTMIYSSRVDTEALVFALDEARVGRWLVANGLATTSDVSGMGAVRRWFAARLEGYEAELPPKWDPEADIDPGDPLDAARALYELIHSVAHQVLRALAVDSGFAEEALSEYLFPHDLAFAIHPNGGTEFTIGALRTVLEQNLDEIVTRAIETDGCLYDPNCMIANRGSDHGCMQLAETSCQAWNWFLSRWQLFGSPDRSITGFWDPRLAG